MHNLQVELKECFETLFILLSISVCCKHWVTLNYEVILPDLLCVHKGYYIWDVDAPGFHKRSLAERWEIVFSTVPIGCLSSEFHGLLKHDCVKSNTGYSTRKVMIFFCLMSNNNNNIKKSCVSFFNITSWKSDKQAHPFFPLCWTACSLTPCKRFLPT